jgi:hypothetical protein
MLQFHENPSTGSKFIPCGRTEEKTDRHGEAISRFPQVQEGT